MKKTKKIRAAIIGLGRIGSLYELDKRAQKYYPYLTHAGTYVKHPQIELVCGADIVPSRRKQFKDMWNIKNIYSDYNQMLKKEDIDILSICTPADQHYQIIKAALKQVKVIFCEKPFTNSSTQIKKIIRLNKKARIPITINAYREYDKSHLEIKKIIKSNKLGRLQRVNCYYGKGLRNMGVHVLSYLDSVLGLPSEVRVLNKKSFKGVKEFTYDLYLKYRGDVPVILQSCDFNEFRLFELDFICQKGRIQILDEGLVIKVFKVKSNKAESGSYELTEKKHMTSSIGKSFYFAADHLVKLYRNKRTKPVLSPERYLELQLLIEKIERQGKGL